MVAVRTEHPSGTERLWNATIAEYYESRDEAPTWHETDDGHREARMKRECAEALAEEYPVEVVDEDDSSDDADADADADADDAPSGDEEPADDTDE